MKSLVNQSSLEDPNLKFLGFGNKPTVAVTEKKKEEYVKPDYKQKGKRSEKVSLK